MAHRDMSESTRMAFHKNKLVIEPTIFDAATHILNGFIVAGKVDESNEVDMVRKSVALALELAVQTDKLMEVEGNLKINVF